MDPEEGSKVHRFKQNCKNYWKYNFLKISLASFLTLLSYDYIFLLKWNGSLWQEVDIYPKNPDKEPGIYDLKFVLFHILCNVRVTHTYCTAWRFSNHQNIPFCPRLSPSPTPRPFLDVWIRDLKQSPFNWKICVLYV